MPPQTSPLDGRDAHRASCYGSDRGPAQRPDHPRPAEETALALQELQTAGGGISQVLLQSPPPTATPRPPAAGDGGAHAGPEAGCAPAAVVLGWDEPRVGHGGRVGCGGGLPCTSGCPPGTGTLRLSCFSLYRLLLRRPCRCCCSIAQACPTLCDPMDRSTPGLPVLHQLPEPAQMHVRGVGDATRPPPPLSSLSPPALSLSQCQGLFHVLLSPKDKPARTGAP